MIAFHPDERASGIPQRLTGLGLDVRPLPIGDASYVLADGLPVRRAEEHDLVSWRRARAVLSALERLRNAHGRVVLLAEGGVSLRLAELHHGALARAVVLGATVLPVADTDEAARWLGRLASETERAHPPRPRLVPPPGAPRLAS